MFSQAVIESLENYVYLLQDPRNGRVFYVGKGNGNRVFDHLAGAVETDGKTEKLDTIREILEAGFSVKHFILRHGLTESVAFEIEAALIDFVGMENLSNVQGGHYSKDFGIKTVGEIQAMYEPEALSLDEPAILINLNKLYRRDMTEAELYRATHQAWALGKNREKAHYAIAAYRGLTREVYRIDDWFPVEVDGKIRWGFHGDLADSEIRERLRYKNIDTYFKRGAAFPVRYLNCA